MLKRDLIIKLLLEGKTVDAVIKDANTTIRYVRQVKREANIINGTERLIEHHVKYREIHGIDETVWLTHSEHRLLHIRLRKEKKCNIPADELRKITLAAGGRTDKCKKRFREYYINNVRFIDFFETFGLNTRLHEHISYNDKTEVFCYTSRFRGTNSHILPIIDI